jgi:hypothetical protein
MPETILMPSGRLDSTAAPVFEREAIAATASGSSRLAEVLRISGFAAIVPGYADRGTTLAARP